MKTIPLTRGYFTKVDDDDYEKFAIHRWYADDSRKSEIRAVRSVNIGNKKIKRVTLSREIMGATEGVVVDHINRDSLDNRKSNLRICTQGENCRNRSKQKHGISKYKGVSVAEKKWKAMITFQGKQIYLGTFSNEKDAAIAYNNKSRELFGEFAYINKL